MDSAGNSSGQDANNHPPVDRGPGNGGRGGTRDAHGGRGGRRRSNSRDSRTGDGN